MHKEWNKADYLMYDYFNETLWKQIKAEGEYEKQHQGHCIQFYFVSLSSMHNQWSKVNCLLNGYYLHLSKVSHLTLF